MYNATLMLSLNCRQTSCFCTIVQTQTGYHLLILVILLLAFPQVMQVHVVTFTKGSVQEGLNERSARRSQQTQPEEQNFSGTCSCSMQTDPSQSDATVQTEVIVSSCAIKAASDLQNELSQLQIENYQQISKLQISEETFRNDDNKVKYYTGLPTIFQFLQPHVPIRRTALTQFQQFILV